MEIQNPNKGIRIPRVKYGAGLLELIPVKTGAGMTISQRTASFKKISKTSSPTFVLSLGEKRLEGATFQVSPEAPSFFEKNAIYCI